MFAANAPVGVMLENPASMDNINKRTIAYHMCFIIICLRVEFV